MTVDIVTQEMAATLGAAIKAGTSMDNAQIRFEKAVKAMSESGWKAESIQPAGKSRQAGPLYDTVCLTIAESILNKSEFALFCDETQPQRDNKAKGRPRTERGKMIHRVSERVVRIHSALVALEGDKGDKGAAKGGRAGKGSKSPLDLWAGELQSAYSRAFKLADSDDAAAFKFDLVAFCDAVKAAGDVAGIKVKDPK